MTIADLSYGSLLFYSLASISYLCYFQQESQDSNRRWPLSEIGLVAMVLGAIAAACSLIMEYRSSSTHELNAAFALVTLLGTLSAAIHLRFGARSIGVFTAPTSTLILMGYFALSQTTRDIARSGLTEQELITPGWLVVSHVTMAITGEAFAIVAFGAACLFLLQQSALKGKRLKLILRRPGPALDNLDTILFWTTWIGFLCLSLSLVSGAWILSHRPIETTENLGSKIIWAITVWVWYLSILIVRNVYAWSSKRIAQMCVAGFIILATMLFGLAPLGGS